MISELASLPPVKIMSSTSRRSINKSGVLRFVIGLFLATALAGAAAHETVDLDKANELVAAADSAAERAKTAANERNEGELLFSLGAILIQATDLLNRDLAAHSGALTLNGQILLKAFAARNLAPQFDEPLSRYLLPRQQLERAIRLAPAASYAPRARFALLKASFYESFVFDPFEPLSADISALEKESSEAEALVRLLEDPEQREEATFIHAMDLAREVKLASNAEITSTIGQKARAALKSFAETYPNSMRAASATVILEGLERNQQ